MNSLVSLPCVGNTSCSNPLVTLWVNHRCVVLSLALYKLRTMSQFGGHPIICESDNSHKFSNTIQKLCLRVQVVKKQPNLQTRKLCQNQSHKFKTTKIFCWENFANLLGIASGASWVQWRLMSLIASPSLTQTPVKAKCRIIICSKLCS